MINYPQVMNHLQICVFLSTLILMLNIKCHCLSLSVVERHTRAYSRIVYHFGPQILLENGEIDRQKLGQIIFANEEKRKLLNSITHPEIHKEMLKEILFYFLRGEGGAGTRDMRCGAVEIL